MLKINASEFLNHPLYTSLLVVDIGLLMFLPLIRPPVVLSMILVGGLVYLSMYFGTKFSGSELE